MAEIRLVNLMKIPITLQLGGRVENEVVLEPSGKDLSIVKNMKNTGVAGPGGKVALVYEFPEKATGIPDEIAPEIRYVVTAVAFEALPDRKDFVTPSRPIRDKDGKVRAYRHLRGHSKDDVTRFFEAATASGSAS